VTKALKGSARNGRADLGEKDMNTENMVEIPRDKLVALIKGAYERSHAVGMGFLQPFENVLTDNDAKDLIHQAGSIAVSMDYVNGRCCKFTVRRDEEGKLWTARDHWHDHSDNQLQDLLKSVGLIPA
jgi:hypothetical protein